MRRIIVMVLFLVSTSVNIVLAADDDIVTWRAKKTFEKEFPGAQFAKWEELTGANMYIVRFVYKDQALLAYIDEDGFMVATVRSWNKENLPFMVNETIDKKYKDFTVSRVEELVTPTDVSYLVSVENAKSHIVLRVYSNGTSYRIKKEKRNVVTSPVHRG